MPCIIYADMESFIRKIDGCANNPENSSTTKIGQHIPCRYSMLTISAFDNIKKQVFFVSWGRLYEKGLRIFKRTREKYN